MCWMLGTCLACMGWIVTAAGGEATLGRRALPALAATIVVALIVRLAGVTLALPVATGGAFTLVLAALALVALAPQGLTRGQGLRAPLARSPSPRRPMAADARPGVVGVVPPAVGR